MQIPAVSAPVGVNGAASTRQSRERHSRATGTSSVLLQQLEEGTSIKTHPARRTVRVKEVSPKGVAPHHHSCSGIYPVCRAAAGSAAPASTFHAGGLKKRHARAIGAERQAKVAHQEKPQVPACFGIGRRSDHRALRPNPSLKRSANGRPPGPCGAVGYPAPHGPGVLPLSPA